MEVTTRIARSQPALFAGLVLLAACVSAGTQELRTSPPTAVARDVLTQAEIFDSHAATAYEAIERLRPQFLLTKLDLGPTAVRQVFLNGVSLTGFSDLRAIPASSVREIRFVRAIDGTPFGTTHSGGVILVISKAGR